ncbi:MAG: hypothetical protein JSV91_10305 [Phycisphaerales bacterium]|nr:MAG: hypothetical protein JSV91_10305 [Phycisphaerales bacterium]
MLYSTVGDETPPLTLARILFDPVRIEVIGDIQQQVTYGTLTSMAPLDSTHIVMTDRDNDALVTIDTTIPAAVSSVPLDQDYWVTHRGFDITPDGVYYGLLPGMELRTIDPDTGVTSLISAITGVGRVESIAVTLDRTVYACGHPDNGPSAYLYTIDVPTGVATMIAPLLDAYDVDGLTMAPDGFLYGSDSTTDGLGDDLYRINPSDGTVTVFPNLGINFHGLATAPYFACPADLNDDQTVDIDDVFAVLAYWGQSDVPADINEDGVVDIDDLFEVLAAWGPCP